MQSMFLTTKLMKKFILISAITTGSFFYAQVGINNDAPKATLDVVGAPSDATKFDGIIAPRISGDNLRAKTYTTDQTGALVNRLKIELI